MSKARNASGPLAYSLLLLPLPLFPFFFKELPLFLRAHALELTVTQVFLLLFFIDFPLIGPLLFAQSFDFIDLCVSCSANLT